MFGIVNEPTGLDFGPLNNLYVVSSRILKLGHIMTPTRSYLEAHRIIRNITGVGAGHGPYISIQGGELFFHSRLYGFFLTSSHPGNNDLQGYVGSDRFALEQHPYFAFDGAGAVDITPYITRPCSAWGTVMDTSQRTFGFTTAAEFSLGFNDCISVFIYSTWA